MPALSSPSSSAASCSAEHVPAPPARPAQPVRAGEEIKQLCVLFSGMPGRARHNRSAEPHDGSIRKGGGHELMASGEPRNARGMRSQARRNFCSRMLPNGTVYRPRQRSLPGQPNSKHGSPGERTSRKTFHGNERRREAWEPLAHAVAGWPGCPRSPPAPVFSFSPPLQIFRGSAIALTLMLDPRALAF